MISRDDNIKGYIVEDELKTSHNDLVGSGNEKI